ncbi:MAG: hypothetical protein HEP71_27365 [Roseivirga sp.]|nr:hypothetical protein [Roseivirga sp.]
MALSKPERLSHYGVLIIALTAVVVSVWQGRLSQRQLEIALEHNKLTVRPYLEFVKNIDGANNLMEIHIGNQGYGPAVVESLLISYKNKQYDAWNPVLDAANESNNIRQIYNYSQGSVVAPGTDRTILRLKSENVTKGISVLIKYRSIYQELDSTSINF